MGLLRFVLALSVLLDHLAGVGHTASIFNYQILGGQLAVEAFFIISGFYMTLILNEKYNGFNGAYILYLTNRILRIFPLYWIIMIFSFLYFWMIGDHSIINSSFVFNNNFLNISNLFQNIVANLTLIINISSLVNIPQVSKELYVGPAWSLVIEISFYVLAPILVRGNLKRLLLFFGLSFIWLIIFQHISSLYPILYARFSLSLYLPFFLLGAISYRLYLKLKKTGNVGEGIYWLVSIFILIVTICYNFIPSNGLFSFKQFGFYFLIFLSAPFLMLMEKKNKYIIFLGALSYPIYICHILILMIIDRLIMHFPDIIQHWHKAWLAIFEMGVVLLVSYILKQYICDPIEAYRGSRIKVKLKLKSKTGIIKKNRLI